MGLFDGLDYTDQIDLSWDFFIVWRYHGNTVGISDNTILRHGDARMNISGCFELSWDVEGTACFFSKQIMAYWGLFYNRIEFDEAFSSQVLEYSMIVQPSWSKTPPSQFYGHI